MSVEALWATWCCVLDPASACCSPSPQGCRKKHLRQIRHFVDIQGPGSRTWQTIYYWSRWWWHSPLRSQQKRNVNTIMRYLYGEYSKIWTFAPTVSAIFHGKGRISTFRRLLHSAGEETFVTHYFRWLNPRKKISIRKRKKHFACLHKTWAWF